MAKVIEAMIDVSKHILVPEQTLLTEEEAVELLEKYNITKGQLPKIIKNDAGIKHLNPSVDDVVKIIRKSPTVGETVYYRVVING